MIEFLDGTDAFGKATGCDQDCVKPNGWMMLGTIMSTYVREMRGESRGRLRFVMRHLDAHKARRKAFEDKLVPRKQSDPLLVGVLREILLAQQRRDVLPNPEMQDEPDSEVTEESGGRQRGGKLRRRRKHRGGEEQNTPKLHLGEAVMTVSKMEWKPAATVILAGTTEGANEASNRAGDESGSLVSTGGPDASAQGTKQGQSTLPSLLLPPSPSHMAIGIVVFATTIGASTEN